MIVNSFDEVKAIETLVRASAERTAGEIRKTTGSGLDFLRQLKFVECGRHPTEDRSLNLPCDVSRGRAAVYHASEHRATAIEHRHRVRV
jgi:hypothetical protein